MIAILDDFKCKVIKHLQETGMTLMEFSEKSHLSVHTLSALVQGQLLKLSATEHEKLQAYFSGKADDWVIFPTEAQKELMERGRNHLARASSLLVVAEPGLGTSLSLKSLSLHYPDIQYGNAQSEDFSALCKKYCQNVAKLVEQCPTERGAKAQCLIIDHADQLHNSVLKRLINQTDRSLILSTHKKPLDGLEQAVNFDHITIFRFSGLSKKIIHRLATFYGIDHEQDLNWLEEHSPNFFRLKSNIHQLRGYMLTPDVNPETELLNDLNPFASQSSNQNDYY